MDSQERNLVLSAQRGDTAAFDRLARLHEAALLRVLFGVLGDRDDTYDAYQETLVKAFLRLGSFRFESTFSTWLTRIAINHALNARRASQRRAAEPLDDQHHAVPPVGGDGVDRATIRDAVEKALHSLSDRERTVFVLRHEHEFRIREIAGMLGCAEGTIKNYLFRAIRKMRHALEPRFKDHVTA